MMKRLPIALILPCMLILPGLVVPAQARVIRAQWEYGSNESLAGFRLYYENNPLCELTDPSARSMTCDVDAPDGQALFTLTAFFQDATESLHSAPFYYIFSSTLRALFNADPLAGESPLPVSLDATPSTGNIVSFDWLFGDGESGNGNIVNHTFTTAGNYAVNLKVTDEAGAFDQETASIVVTTPSATNTPPHAVISSSVTVGNAPLQVQFDGSGSSDSDGTIVSYTWAMGDGGTANGPQATYTYLTPGNYTATLTVTDEGGLSDSVSTPVLVGTPTDDGGNKLPIAIITASKDSGPAPLSVSFDGSQSNDPDGSIAKYEWNFGDGSSTTGVSPQHTFAKPAVYTVTLKVTDNKGGQSKLAKFNVRVMKPGTVDKPTPDKTSEVMPYVINLLLNKPPLSSLETNSETDQVEETESPGEQN